ncbi:MAG: YeeE/YedE thiosulfate transporter family protein [Gemmatimonadota bacterium]|nr:YeeE/YedE thiosulfate transporter family protein [Gemmatimonadota bacterium]
MTAAIYALIAGVAMGALIQRVRASSPSMIAANLRLENLSVIKFMATTIAVGAILAYLASAVLGKDAMHFEIKPTYVVGVLLGGLVFGVGFGLGGYCPGTCVVGAGEGRKDALVALLGGVVGALVFTLVFSSVIAPINKLMDYGKLTLDQVLGLPAVGVALGLGAIFLGIVYMLPTVVKKN